jgi:hypothetical protein
MSWIRRDVLKMGFSPRLLWNKGFAPEGHPPEAEKPFSFFILSENNIKLPKNSVKNFSPSFVYLVRLSF